MGRDLLMEIFLIFYYLLIILISFYLIYLDIKSRKIPNKNFNYFFFSALLLNLFELYVYRINFVFFIFFKITILLVFFLFSLSLFHLNLIGGADGKLIILFFFSTPMKILNIIFIFLFIFWFFLFIFIIFVLNFFLNILNHKKEFTILFIVKNVQGIKRKLDYYFNYSLIDFSFFKKSNMQDKCKMDLENIIFSFNHKRLKLIALKRNPLMIVCVLSFFMAIFLV